jgi:predicted protein tyrosine phosphatase
MKIWISNLMSVPGMIQKHGITHVLSVIDHHDIDHLQLPKGFDRNNWLWLDMEDIANPDASTAPQKDQVETILAWGSLLPSDARVLVHCYAGISRSTASALALQVQDWGVDCIDLAVEWLLAARPIAVPNPVITAYADQLLAADGRLFAAAENIAKRRLLAAYGGDLSSRDHQREQD